MSRILVIASTGPSDPNRASIPFHIAANGAAASGVEAGVVLAGDSTELLKEEVAASVAGLGIPPLKELMAACRERGVRFHVCKNCAESRGVTADQIGENAVFIGAPDVVRLSLEADRVLSF